MKHTSQSEFGRAVSLCQTPDDTLCEKWEALTLLTEAAETYDLSHRSLSVLRAMMSFLPNRVINPEHGQAVVFPSNKTLSQRLNGMPESTLRRHLTALIKAGIVSRQDSPNRKRFARRSRLVGDIAFGFDLSPIARELPAIRQAAQEHRNQQDALNILRIRLGDLRQQLIAVDGPCPLAEIAFKILRRKPNEPALRELITQIEDRLNTSKMNATDTQNERHIQIENKNISEDTTHEQHKDASLYQIVDSCKEYQSYFPTPLRHWNDLISIAGSLAPMIGIDRAVLDEAMRIMGLKNAAVCVIVILEKLATIQNPGGYLRRLTQTARSGQFSVSKLLTSLHNCRELSADNSQIPCLSIA